MTLITGFWHEHEAHLRGYIAKRVPDRDAVDDILQDVYLKAHAGLQTVKSPGSITAWLYRIAANAIADHYRSQKPWDELPEDLAAPVAERDVLAELAGCLQPLIADLPEAYRAALILSEIEGLPQKDVAGHLGLSLSGAKSRIQRGREKLLERLLRCCDIARGRGGVVDYEVREKNCQSGCE